MDVEIMILNVMRYTKQGETNEKSRMGYIMINKDCFSSRDKFRGYSELAVYDDSTLYFDKIPIDFIGQKCRAKVEEIPNPQNPLKPRKVFSEVSCNGKTVRLVQS